ncbi:uncharacterized protein LOC123398874 [Hordeum vulgare subsp. vulgare]|uniref:uncharacterized protein LOC123398874 n=1 Tax=Hordeum vulgare subsp. vulgare TaxID=112509 RepID=UPI00162B81F4|nr:uncharacterized protein LOC123398874 [Hordeum vulgare subsp. vulgare]
MEFHFFFFFYYTYICRVFYLLAKRHKSCLTRSVTSTQRCPCIIGESIGVMLLLREVMGDDLYKDVIVAAPNEDEGDFGWIVSHGNEVLQGVADFMAEIQYSILYTETWRAVERDHPIYDHIPYTLRKLIEILDEISANINFACFKRAGPWVIQRMVENHALALLHLEDVLLDFDEVLATGEPVDDAKTSRSSRCTTTFSSPATTPQRITWRESV